MAASQLAIASRRQRTLPYLVCLLKSPKKQSYANRLPPQFDDGPWHNVQLKHPWIIHQCFLLNDLIIQTGKKGLEDNQMLVEEGERGSLAMGRQDTQTQMKKLRAHWDAHKKNARFDYWSRQRLGNGLSLRPRQIIFFLIYFFTDDY